MLCPAHILGYLSTVSRVRTGRYLQTIILPVLTKEGSEVSRAFGFARSAGIARAPGSTVSRAREIRSSKNLSSICQSRIIAVEARITLCKSSPEGAK